MSDNNSPILHAIVSVERGIVSILPPAVEPKTSEHASTKQGFINSSTMKNGFLLTAIRKSIKYEAFTSDFPTEE